MGSKSSTPAAPSAANANSTQPATFGAGGGTGSNGLGAPAAGSYAADGSQISFGTGNPADFSSQRQQLQNAYGPNFNYDSWASNPINSSQVVSNPALFQAQAQAGQQSAPVQSALQQFSARPLSAGGGGATSNSTLNNFMATGGQTYASASPGGSSYGAPPTMQPASNGVGHGGSSGGQGATYAPVDNSSGAMSIPLATSAGSAAQSGLSQAGVTNAGYGQIQNQLANQDLTGAFNQQQQAAYNGQMAYLQPQQTQQTQQQIDALAQQGITQSSNPTAYANAMNLLHNQQAYTNQQAYNSSYANGLAGANQLFSQGLQSGQFANSAQAQGFNQSATNAGYANTAALQNASMGNQVGMYNAGQSNSMNQYNAALNNSANTQQLNDYTVQAMLPYNQLNALNGMTNQYTTGSPTLGTTNQTAGQQSPNLMQASQNNYNSQLASYNNQQSGLYGLGSAAIMALA
jgi:hypothetical protein